ncbi:MAG: glycosyltransferase [Clostridia bacterium]|nr:glycosyltransferase [Clostridia bacterium]
MKIMILTGAMGSGGVQTHIFELAKGLMARGHKIILISSGGERAKELSRLGAKCYCIHVDISKPVSVLGGALALYALMLRERPQIIHAHTRPHGLLCRLMEHLIKDPPVYVSTVHARFSTDSPIRRLPWYSSDSITVGEDLKHYLLTLSHGTLLPERIKVIPNGIDVRRFRPRKRGGQDGTLRLCFMSRLDPDCSETARLLCRIAPRICEAEKGLEIYIIGGGSELPEICELADEANRRIGRLAVRAIGSVSAPELILSRCDGFIGVSRAALEAMSCALPVILSGNEGFFGLLKSDRELCLAQGSNFCARGQRGVSEELLAKSILELCSMPLSERTALGQRMRRFVINHNSSDKMVADTERYYEKALSRKDAHGAAYLLCGYYGFGNMGDDALLLQAIERAGGSNTVALTRSPRKDSFRFGVKCADRSSPLSVIREIKRCQVLAFGGGSLLQSRTSFRSLCWYSALLMYARSQGKRVELWANGIGDFSNRLSRRLAARALRAVDRIGVRDEASAALVRELAPECAARIVKENDLALSCPAASDERAAFVLSTLKISPEERFAIVAPKGFSKIALLSPTTRKKAAEEYAALRAALRELRRRDITPVFVAMYPAQDAYVSRKLCAAYGGRMARSIGFSDLSALIARAAGVISMRYHPLLLAKHLGTRSIKIGDDPKILALTSQA